MNILFIDDDDAFREVTTDVLKKVSGKIALFGAARPGLDRLGLDDADVVFGQKTRVNHRMKDEASPGEGPVEMIDTDAAGKEEGIFAKGSTVRYDLVVRSDVGSEAFPNLHVLFTLPAELEFISGGGDGVTVKGSSKTATSSTFKLPLEGEVKIFILARVLEIPASPFVKTSASILNDAGEELALETESTSLAGIGTN